MKFVLKKYYNIPEPMFNHEPKLTYNFVGNLLIDNIIGPTGSTAIDNSKAISLKKAVSEAVERRALMAGGYKEEDGTIGYFDLINQSMGYMDFNFSRYQVSGKHVSDTTGTAVAYNSHDAIYKAFTELLEKNCLFLFWYGLLGKEVHLSSNNTYLLAVKNAGYQVNLYEVDYFSPFMTYITIIHNGHNCVYAYGVSGDLGKTIALNHSIKESYLMLWQNTFKVKRNLSIYDDFSKPNHIAFIQHLKRFTNSIDFVPDTSINNNHEISDLIRVLPDWITELNVVMLKSNSRQRQKVVLLFSRDLLNSVPLKRVINLDIPINKNTVNLSKHEFDEIPDCMIV